MALRLTSSRAKTKKAAASTTLASVRFHGVANSQSRNRPSVSATALNRMTTLVKSIITAPKPRDTAHLPNLFSRQYMSEVKLPSAARNTLRREQRCAADGELAVPLKEGLPVVERAEDVHDVYARA